MARRVLQYNNTIISYEEYRRLIKSGIVSSKGFRVKINDENDCQKFTTYMEEKQFSDKWIEENITDIDSLKNKLPQLIEDIWYKAMEATLQGVMRAADHLEYNTEYADVDTIKGFYLMNDEDQNKVKYLDVDKLTSTVFVEFEMHIDDKIENNDK